MRPALVLVVLLLAVTVVRAEPVAVRDMRHAYDPVVVRTALLGNPPDRHTAHYRVFAARDGRLEPIPFQFDPMDADGMLVFTDGADDSFDRDDELVLMAKDTGDRVDTAQLPAGGGAAFEIEVTDAARGTRGWAYLVYFPETPPPVSPVRYAHFDVGRNTAETPWYEIRYAPPPSNHLVGLRVAATSGAPTTPLIDGTRMRIGPTFSLLLTTWSPVFTERSFTVKPEGVRNGAVRAIRRVRQSLDMGRFFPELPNGRVQTFYYENAVLTPSTFEIPSIILAALRDFRFEAIHDFGARAPGTRYWDAANPDGLPLDAARDRAGTDADHGWWVASGATGTLLNAFVIPQLWRDWGITRGTVLSGDDDAPDVHGAGYRLRKMTNLRRGGSYALATAMVILPTPYTPGDEAEALAMLDTPLDVRVHPMRQP
ncbi:MAG TPA: hypothetical protein VGR62_14770 [Candidatus Binatia bacterium]|jgi:hypothetical protein|nr:hypothetical protein [Candidatus Binatia bacterium]